jgi:uncharacterized protein YjiS (DUF1127 family)
VERTIATKVGIRVNITRSGSRIGDLLRTIVSAIKIRTMRRKLEALPDYLLKDVGISRSEIETVIRYGRCISAHDSRNNMG